MSTSALGWVAPGTHLAVITDGDKMWTGDRTDLHAGQLSQAIRDMRNGDWEPSEADGWEPAQGPFDSEGYLGWVWTEVGNDASDIAWSDLTAAGIDVDNVNRGDARLGQNWYEHVDDERRVVFGPGEDPSDGTTMGWDIHTYYRDGDGWADGIQTDERTKELALAYVRRQI